ncbi:hypothetical protein D7I47_13350 [Protaetiibacter intestinalis]|uniref:Uncharacterized protein n=1 Tax=Protaetiibacter intestinalis TaxID=2419774 RepID=A0A387B652_9MICO|nr:hypothetical protein D7I47_13350 [Protaetiibacter intestinalis]
MARLLSPLPDNAAISSRAEPRVRLAAAVTAARAVEVTGEPEAKTAVMVTAGWLAGQINTTPRQAQKILTALERGARWTRRTGSAGGGRLLFRFTKLDAEANEVAWAHGDAIEALAQGRPDTDPLAAVIATAAHPAWSYSEGALGPRAFLALLLHNAEPGAWVGLTPAGLRAGVKELDRWGLREPGIDLLSALDTIAEETLAVFVATDRRREMQEASARERQRLEAYRAGREERYQRRRVARAILRRALDVAGAPPSGTDRAAIETWVPRLAVVVRPELVDAETASAVHDELGEILARAGFSAEFSGKAAAFVAPVAAAA